MNYLLAGTFLIIGGWLGYALGLSEPPECANTKAFDHAPKIASTGTGKIILPPVSVREDGMVLKMTKPGQYQWVKQ